MNQHPIQGAIIVLNYNGAGLLTSYLGSVIKAAEHATIPTKVIVADNGSTDTSHKIVSTFPKVTWLDLGQNFGFGRGNNKAVEATKADIVVLLNSDIDPDLHFLDPLYAAFEDPTIFAASCHQTIKHRDHAYAGGGSVGEWKNGLLRHRPVEEVYGKQTKPVPTFYPDAGASAYRRKQFLALGGFSPVFTFYWEDADLGFRAWKHGLSSVYVPASKVIHYHESTISRQVSSWRKQAIGWHGIFLFTWRGIDSFSMLLTHLFWLPFHIIYALCTGHSYRVYGLFLALPKITQRVTAPSGAPSTLAIVKKARPTQ